MSNSPGHNNQLPWTTSAKNDPVAAIPNLQETMCMLQMMSSEGPLAQLAKEKSVMTRISIPGLSTIFGGGNITRRVVWSVVVVTALLVATIQVILTNLFRIDPRIFVDFEIGIVIFPNCWL